MAFINFIE